MRGNGGGGVSFSPALPPYFFLFFPLATRRQIKQADDLTGATPRGNEPSRHTPPPAPVPGPGPQGPSGRGRKEKSRVFPFPFQELELPLEILARTGTGTQVASRGRCPDTEVGLGWIRTQGCS